MTKTQSELMDMYASVVDDMRTIIKHCPPHSITIDNSMEVIESLARSRCDDDEEVVFIDEAFQPFVFEIIRKMVVKMIETKQKTHLHGLKYWLSESRCEIEAVEMYSGFGIRNPRRKNHWKNMAVRHKATKSDIELLEYLILLESRLQRYQDALEEAKRLYGISEQKEI